MSSGWKPFFRQPGADRGRRLAAARRQLAVEIGRVLVRPRGFRVAKKYELFHWLTGRSSILLSCCGNGAVVPAPAQVIWYSSGSKRSSPWPPNPLPASARRRPGRRAALHQPRAVLARVQRARAGGGGEPPRIRCSSGCASCRSRPATSTSSTWCASPACTGRCATGVTTPSQDGLTPAAAARPRSTRRAPALMAEQQRMLARAARRAARSRASRCSTPTSSTRGRARLARRSASSRRSSRC